MRVPVQPIIIHDTTSTGTYVLPHLMVDGRSSRPSLMLAVEGII